MKIFFISGIILSLSFAVSSADAFKRRKKTVYKECPLAVVEGMSVSQDCRNNTRVCPVAVEQSSLLHPSCSGLTKRCPTVSSSIPPGCNSVTTLSKPDAVAEGATAMGGGSSIGDNLEWACTTDDNGVGTCNTQESCTVENNVRRCRTCTETITVQASEGNGNETTNSDNSESSGETNSTQ